MLLSIEMRLNIGLLYNYTAQNCSFFSEKFVLGIHLHIHYLVPCASALKFLGNIWVTSNYSWFRKWTFLLPLMPSDFVISKICNKFINDVEPKSGC